EPPIASQESLPIVLTLDGEYMFYSLVGAMELLSTNDDMPPAIVVGVDQNYKVDNEERFYRWQDCDYVAKTGELTTNSLEFKQFLLSELIPFVKEKYNGGEYIAMAGHSFTGNFIFHFIHEPSITGFISCSPYIADASLSNLHSNISNLALTKYLYLSTASNDLRMHKAKLLTEDSTLFHPLKSPLFKYQFDLFENESHMTLTYPSALNGLRFLFQDYCPLYKLDYSETEHIENYLEYLRSRYANIQNVYKINLPYRDEDLSELVWVAVEKEKWDQVKDLAELQIQTYPSMYSGYYSLGSYFEGIKDYEKALFNYEKGYGLLGPEVSNKVDFYEDILRIKKLME
ncbi:MAG: alpha/beta hydrolase-fold protein, partial [Flavobacteriales bacterium]